MQLIDCLKACSLVTIAERLPFFLTQCIDNHKRAPELVVSAGGSVCSVDSSSENRRTPSVRTAMSWSTLISEAYFTAEVPLPLESFVENCCSAVRIVLVARVSVSSWAASFGASLVAVAYGRRISTAPDAAVMMPKTDAMTLSGSIGDDEDFESEEH